MVEMLITKFKKMDIVTNWKEKTNQVLTEIKNEMKKQMVFENVIDVKLKSRLWKKTIVRGIIIKTT